MFEDLKPQVNKSINQDLPAQAEISKSKEPQKAEDIFSGADADKDKPFLNEVNKEDKRKKEEEAEKREISGNKKKIIFISISVSAVILIVCFFVVLNKWGSQKLAPSEAERSEAESQKPVETGGESGIMNQESGILPAQEVERVPIEGGQGGVIQPVTIDSDGDGLTDEVEAKLGTSPNNVDTDSDGLSDREEIKVYKTDPLNPDTDNDGYSDGAETKGGYNPKGEGKLYGNHEL